MLTDLANKYFEAGAKKQKEASGKPKADAAAADKELEKVKQKLDDAKMAALKATKDTSKTAADIKAATEQAKLAEEAYKEAKKGFTFPGLGKLVLVQRKARIGRNPATGAAIKIPAKKVLKFRIAKAAKDSILGAKK